MLDFIVGRFRGQVFPINGRHTWLLDDPMELVPRVSSRVYWKA